MKTYDYANKKILILVPHEDDELNLVGGFLELEKINKKNCYISFLTNGDFDFLCKTRIKEAKKSLKYLGIPNDNIIFMGYADQLYNEKSHIYHTYSPNIFTSKNGHKKTYCINDVDYHYKIKKEHNDYNYNSLLEDIVLLIENIKPDIIFAIDFDSHPDHRCCSLTFEKAMGIVLKNNLNYSPQVFKGFAYPTVYKGIDDFNDINVKSTQFNSESFSLSFMQNPYYNWNERVRFPVGNKVLNKNLILNKLYKNLKKHRSQLIIKKSYSIINSDQIFWQRRTDNLAMHSKIEVSSGNKEYLNDFMLFDCKNILDGNKKKPEIDFLSWIPSDTDKNKIIKFEFNEHKNIKEIILYKDLNYKKNSIKNIEIRLSNNYKKKFELDDELKNTLSINQNNINWIEIKVLDKKISSGFSEIEIFEAKEIINEYIKILNKDDFVYNNYLFNSLNIYIYSYNGVNSKYLNTNDCNYYINNNIIEYEKIKDIKLNKFILKASLKDNPNISDEVLLRRVNNYYKLKNFIINKLNKIILNYDIFYSRVINKIKRIFKMM